MSNWKSAKARRVLAALERIGWRVKRQRGGSHKVLEHPDSRDYISSFHDGEEIGTNMMARIAKRKQD